MSISQQQHSRPRSPYTRNSALSTSSLSVQSHSQHLSIGGGRTPSPLTTSPIDELGLVETPGGEDRLLSVTEDAIKAAKFTSSTELVDLVHNHRAMVHVLQKLSLSLYELNDRLRWVKGRTAQYVILVVFSSLLKK